MRLFEASADDGMEYEVTFEASDPEEAELICHERDWILLGEVIEIPMGTVH